jgi:hypothetical protein
VRYFYEELLNELNYDRVKPNLRFLIHIFVIIWIMVMIVMLPVLIITFVVELCISWLCKLVKKILYVKD